MSKPSSVGRSSGFVGLGIRPPGPGEIAEVPAPVLGAAIRIGEALKDIRAKWAIGGDAGEVMQGVNVHPDRLEILTTKEGAVEICGAVAEFVTAEIAVVEKKLVREAEIDGKQVPVKVRSYHAQLSVEKVTVDVDGDLQIKVGEWDWGDPLDFEPSSVNLVGTRVPVVPLRLKTELYIGLGWLDRARLISDAVIQAHHYSTN